MDALTLLGGLVRALSDDPRILGIGQTGSPDAALIPGRSDIDLFVLCSEVPPEDERRALYAQLGDGFDLHMSVCNGGRWGYGDILVAGGVDVMPMYFPLSEMRDYLTRLLSGEGLDKEGRFYPVGRLASVSTIHVLHEKARAWSELRDLVNEKPDAFFRAWYAREICQVLDEEDLGRCEVRREVLFFHQVLENALDHLLQALYAVNRCYFPSRKRTLTALDAFRLLPDDCAGRLLRLVQDGACEETMDRAMTDLRQLTAEVVRLGREVFPGGPPQAADA